MSALAQQAGVTVRFRPFLLGPLFKGHGWPTCPFNLVSDVCDFAELKKIEKTSKTTSPS